MVSIHEQFIALARAALERSKVATSVQKQLAYEALEDAINALPLDALAGQPALEPERVVDRRKSDVPPVVRLSQVGGHCVYCNAIMGEALECPGCKWIDPPTVGS